MRSTINSARPGHAAVQKKRLTLCIPLLLLLAFGVPAHCLGAAALNLYVAPNGNDRWSGHLPAPAADGEDGPLATLPKAIHAARLARPYFENSSGGITILIRGGVYELAEPLVLTAEDSGASAKQLFTIAAYPGETAILSGGRRIGNWRKVERKPGLWEAELPEVPNGKWYFRSLFINGQRKHRARTPNAGFFRIQ